MNCARPGCQEQAKTRRPSKANTEHVHWTQRPEGLYVYCSEECLDAHWRRITRLAEGTPTPTDDFQACDCPEGGEAHEANWVAEQIAKAERTPTP